MNQDIPAPDLINKYRCEELQALIEAILPVERTNALWEKLEEVAKYAGIERDYPSILTHYAQAFNAIQYVINRTKGSQSHTAIEIIDLFDQLLKIKSSVPYEGHSIGIEIEIGADHDAKSQFREIRLGPFNDIESAMKTLRLARKINDMCGDNAMSTLHLNFGLNSRQKLDLAEGLPQYIFENSAIQCIKKPYRDITEKLGYISNSAARNVKIADNYIGLNTPLGYYENHEYRGDFIKTDIEPVGSDGEYHDQVARLECKGFCLARDADINMLEPIIGAMWKAIDDPAQAKLLDRHLDGIFADGNIIPVHKQNLDLAPLWSDNGIPTETYEEAKYKLDFGMEHCVPRDEGGHDMILLGKTTAWREPIQVYLESYVKGNPEIPHELYPSTEFLAGCQELVDTWVNKHPEPRKVWTDNTSTTKSYEIALLQPNGIVSRGR